MRIRGRVVGLLIAGVLAACTTYHGAGFSGGFSETRLSDTSFEVRFRGNGFTSPARVSSLMLRRAAELTLESGYRYFVVDHEENLDRHDAWGQYPQRSAMVHFLAEPTPTSADAVVVVRETDELAGGELSVMARETLRRFQTAAK